LVSSSTTTGQVAVGSHKKGLQGINPNEFPPTSKIFSAGQMGLLLSSLGAVGRIKKRSKFLQ